MSRSLYTSFLCCCFCLFLSCLIFFSCSRVDSEGRQQALQQWMADDGRLKVLSTIAMINDLVAQVGGEHVDAMALIQGESDPHSYQLVKGDNEKFLRADLIFYNGLGLEHGASLQSYLQGNQKVISVADNVQKEDAQLILCDHGQPDPHLWMDISLWAKTIPFIVSALSEKDEAHAAYYRANGEKLQLKMMHAHAEIKKEMELIPVNKRYLVTSHDAFSYFARAYLATDEEKITGGWQARFVAPEGLAPESQLSTRDLQLIIDHLDHYHIHILFPETNVSKDAMRKIVEAGRKKGLELSIAAVALYGDAMGSPGSDGDTYLKMMLHNADTIAYYWTEH